MPNVYKLTYTREIPSNSERCEYRGRAAVRWKGRGGKWVYGTLVEGSPNRCTVESAAWYYKLPGSGRKPIKGTTNKEATQAIADKAAADLASDRVGVTRRREHLALTELLDRWQRYLTDRECTSEHVKKIRNRVQFIVDGIGANVPADITPAKVLAWLSEKRRGPKFGTTSMNHYIVAIKSFCRWMAIVERVDSPGRMEALSRETDKTDKRHIRRVLTAEEFGRLVRSAREGESFAGLSGAERAVLYIVASTTGLRASELASLRASSFHLDTTPPTVTVDAAYSKHRRRDVLPLHSGIVEEVRAHIANFPTGPIWPNRMSYGYAWLRIAVRMLRFDLKRAGIPYRDARGHVYDFHAIRSQFISDLDSAGVSLARMQMLARHSSPALTSHYTKRTTGELKNEIEKLPLNLG